MTKRAGFLQYIKSAFVNHWNLLAVGAGVLGGVISGQADIVFPMIAAVEMSYLAGLASHPKFQAYVDAKKHKATRQEQGQQVVQPALGRMFAAIDPASRARFEALRRRARELRTLAQEVRPGAQAVGPVNDMQNESINKLLWIFLKLLYSRFSIERFLRTTHEQELQNELNTINTKIEALGDVTEDTSNEARMRRSLIDTLASVQLRLDNLTQAQENFEFLGLEINRLENKITSIAELAVSRQDPDFITSEVDGVAATMQQTEAAINDLHLLDIEGADAPPPAFLDAQYLAQ